MFKLYIKSILIILNLAVVLGFIAPLLFSAPSDIALGLGVLVILADIPILYYMIGDTFTDVKRMITGE